MPVLVKDLGDALDQGPVLVTIQYSVIPECEAEFLNRMSLGAR